jgi:peptide/nickel transport system ATP-binding protein
MPRLDRERTERLRPIHGTPPSLINVPSGCPFHPRCVYAELNGGVCETDRPEFLEISPRHFLACHLSTQDRQRVWENDIKPTL